MTRRAPPKITVAELLTSAASADGLPRAGSARDRVPGPLERRQVQSLERAGRAPRARAHLGERPARRACLNWFRVVRGGRELWLVDLPGYGYAKVAKSERAEWKGWIEAYLDRRPTLRLAVLLQDLRRDPGEDETLLLQWLAERDVPTLVALTKCDKEKPMRRAERVRVLGKAPELPAGQILATSAETRLGIPELWAAIDRSV